jgi:hypothetical protein
VSIPTRAQQLGLVVLLVAISVWVAWTLAR